MSNRIDKPSIQKGKPHAGKRSIHSMPIAAIAVEQEWSFGKFFRVFMIDQRNRNAGFPISRRRPYSFGNVVFAMELSSQNFLLFQQFGGLGFHIVLIGRIRCSHGNIAIAQSFGFKL